MENTHPKTLTLKTPAKINLVLRVIDKRPDGYHNIVSLMQPVSIFDEVTVTVEDGAGITVTCSDPSVPCDGTNLAAKAAKAFFEAAGMEKKVSIDIKKNIPVAGGVAGGSSDAAAVIKALQRLTGAGLSVEKLREIALSIGSDVPFFFAGGPAVARGSGETLEAVKIPQFYYVIVNPGFNVSTAWVYGNLSLTKVDENNILINLKDSLARHEALVGILSNDLESVTISKHPFIGELKGLLKSEGALGALMSGSGPTVFGVFTDGVAASRAFRSLSSSLKPPVKVFLAEGI